MTKVFHVISNKEWGGGEQYVFDLCQRQLADGIHVELFCLPVDAIITKFKELNVPVYALPLHGAYDLCSAWKMSRIIKTAGPCTIHAHNFKDAYTAAYARKLSGNKAVRVVMCRHLTRKGKTSWLYRWLYSQLDCLVFDSQLSKDTFLSTRPTIDEEKLRIVHTSIVVPDSVETTDIRKEFHIPEDDIIAMFHGRLDQEKGLDILIDAISRLREDNFRMVLVGRGSKEYTEHLQQLLAEKGLEGKVIFAGFRHPVLPYVSAADFGILPSIVREGCPLSPMEYMSQGRPVIATDNGGQQEYITSGKNGLLIPPNDSAALAAAISQLTTDTTLRQTLGKQAQEDFTKQLNYEHFYRLIKEIYHASV